VAQNTYAEPKEEQRIDPEEFVVAETQELLKAPEVLEEREAPVAVDPNRPARRKKK
jgi:hypothetical protein